MKEKLKCLRATFFISYITKFDRLMRKSFRKVEKLFILSNLENETLMILTLPDIIRTNSEEDIKRKLLQKLVQFVSFIYR